MIVRLMGEIDIHSFSPDTLLAERASLDGVSIQGEVTDGDVINWLGWA